MAAQTFTKYAGNPVVPQITGGNRDPKVFWHEPTKRWVMTLYVEKAKKHTIHILTSPNLKDWTIQSEIEGFFECPDLFELAVSGTPATKKWLLTAASGEYMLGRLRRQDVQAGNSEIAGPTGPRFLCRPNVQRHPRPRWSPLAVRLAPGSLARDAVQPGDDGADGTERYPDR